MLSAGGSSGKGYLLFKRPSRPTATAEPQNLPRRDEHEKSEIHTSKEGPIRSKDGDTSDTPQLARSSVFTWRELTYTVCLSSQLTAGVYLLTRYLGARWWRRQDSLAGCSGLVQARSAHSVRSFTILTTLMAPHLAYFVAFCSLMGSSGAGKTTLMDVLAQRKVCSNGSTTAS